MEAYAQALTYAIPVFLALIAAEAIWAWSRGMKINRGADTISSLSSGMTNILKDVLGLSIAVVGYDWLVRRVAIFEIGTAWYVYIIAFVAKDFAGYWIHRIEHTVNIFWNRHIIHHSSEEFNLACALRQSISEVFSFIGLFLLPAALVGVPTQVIAVIAPVQLFAQFWYHTRMIGKMGWLEKVIVTPSHHRVHHAMNAEYLDKNFGQVFILWDKWFGTFQPELADVPPVYGVKRPVHTWNPFLIGLQHVWLLVRDAWRANNLRDKLRIWFMPTGWRPADVAARWPVAAVDDVYALQKFDTRLPLPILAWAWVRLAVTLMLILDLFFRFGTIGLPGVYLYGLFLGVTIFGMTAMLDRARYAVIADGLAAALVLWLLAKEGGTWFGAPGSVGMGVAAFALIALLVSGMTSWASRPLDAE
jgi:sterol desaturase/sphingolipid hydroxylase (fatty acid hydroxylase superfamily)